MNNDTKVKKRRGRRQKLTGIERKEALTGYLFITPYMALFLLFTGIPFVAAFALSFLDVGHTNQLDNVSFVFLNNFIRLFQDSSVMGFLWNTAKYSLIYVPVIMVLSFIFAYILNKSIYTKKFIRSLIFLPYVSNIVAIAVVFRLMLGPRSPFIRLMNEVLGTSIVSPFLSATWSLPIIVLVGVWKGMGLNIITFLGALQSVPTELVEAAEIDGANKWQQIRNVVIPSISPTTFFLLISSTITSMQNYTIIMAFNEGTAPLYQTTMAVSIVDTAFTRFQTSYASAQAILMFAIVMVFTLLQWRGQKKWVNY